MRENHGDPSLVLHTSASLGDKKVAFMKACSKAIATTLCNGIPEPESYVRGQGWLGCLPLTLINPNLTP